jgi:heptaprenyl diphosphate synthase
VAERVLDARYRDATTVSPAVGYGQRAEADLAVVVEWLREYVSKPAKEVGRTGPVCPFVPPALDDNAVRFDFFYDLDCREPERLRSVVVDLLHEFEATAAPPNRAGTSLASMVIVLPDTDAQGWAAIDALYPELKDVAIELGLMIGQFHPNCDERAVRNPAFPVSRSPVALLAVRRIAPHDVLFLHDDPRWFTAYEKRFGTNVRAGKVRDKLMRQLHATAASRFLPGAPEDDAA